MTQQLQLVLDVPAPGRACRAQLVHGYGVLLAWLDGLAELPADWSAWPCATCLAAPGSPCDIPGRYRRCRWLPADREQLHHLDRGLDGRWACRIPGWVHR